jgi:hypothetical protein
MISVWYPWISPFEPLLAVRGRSLSRLTPNACGDEEGCMVIVVSHILATFSQYCFFFMEPGDDCFDGPDVR